MTYRTFTDKPNLFVSIMKNLMVSTIPIFGLIHALNHNEVWKWLIIYMPIGLVGYYIVGTTGVIIDIENKRFKIFKSLFWGDIGRWEKLPNIERIVLKCSNQFKDTTVKNTGTDISYSWTKNGYREMHYKIALLNSRANFLLEILDTKDKDEAYKLGESLSKNLNIELEKIKQ